MELATSRTDLSGFVGKNRSPYDIGIIDQTSKSDQEQQEVVQNSSFWWIIIVVVVIIILAAIGGVLWWYYGSSNSSSSTDNNSSSTNNSNTNTSNTGNNAGSSIFDTPSNNNPNSTETTDPLSVKMTGYISNNSNVQGWFYNKTLDLAPSNTGFLITEIDGKKYGLTIRNINNTARIFLSSYSDNIEDENNIYIRCSIVRWNYRETQNGIEYYLIGDCFGDLINNIRYKNICVDNEGTPNGRDKFDDEIPVILTAEYDKQNKVVQYYLMDVAGNPVCRTQQYNLPDNNQIPIGLVNPTVFKEQYTKLPIIFQLIYKSTEPLNYPDLRINPINRNSPIKLSTTWNGRWSTGSSVKQYPTNDQGLLPVVLVRLNGLDYSLSTNGDKIDSLKLSNLMSLAPVDYTKVPVYLQDNTNRTRLSILSGMKKVEIRQGSTGILNVDEDQTIITDETLQIYEDTSDTSPNRFMLIGKFQTPVIILNRPGIDVTEVGTIGLRIWNPDIYPKQKKLILRFRMRPTGINWTYRWMKCERCSECFNFNYDLDDGLDGNLDERKAGRCPNSRYRWFDDYGFGHLERHDDHNYVVPMGETWGICVYCRSMCSFDIAGSCFNREQNQMVPHNIYPLEKYTMEMFANEHGGAATSNYWFLCDRCGVLFRDEEGIPSVCSDGNRHYGRQSYLLRSEKGRWNT